MPPRAILRTLCCALVASATFAALPVLAAEEKPNILFILADNVGFGDLGVYGGGELRGAPTPHIDQLAAEKSQADAVSRRTELGASPSATLRCSMSNTEQRWGHTYRPETPRLRLWVQPASCFSRAPTVQRRSLS